MSAPLDSRVVRIVRWLLDQDEARSTSELAAALVLSERAVRYRLSAVQNFLASHGGELIRQRGTGLSIVAEDDARDAIIADLDARTSAPRVYAPDERVHLLLDTLLWAYPETISLDRLHDDLEVSKTSARRDLRRCEPWLERMGLPVLRKPGQGIALHGSEQRVRRALVQLFLEAVPADVLDELTTRSGEESQLLQVRVPTGLRERLQSLPILCCAEAIRNSALHDRLSLGNSELLYALFVAISQCRISQDRPIVLGPGQFISLIDHPASEAIKSLADELTRQGCPTFSDDEVAGLTEYLLGFEALLSQTSATEEIDRLADDMLAIATERLHASLVDDDELRRSLTMHLTRLAVRIRYELPVHNPLVDEVAERYPDVQAVAVDLGQLVGERLGAEINDDEIGFITMYLSGALERGHLRPRKRAMVVCPSGMATAWVLVSRLQAEFPELSLADVQSATTYEDSSDSFDIVISTVPLDFSGAPVVVVNPLLSSMDVRTIRSAL